MTYHISLVDIKFFHSHEGYAQRYSPPKNSNGSMERHEMVKKKALLANDNRKPNSSVATLGVFTFYRRCVRYVRFYPKISHLRLNFNFFHDNNYAKC